jgi:dihydrofolate reductase
MRTLIVQEWISLDGYASDKNNSLDFFIPIVREVYTDEYHKNFLDPIDCIVFGRKTYQQFAALWPNRPTEEDLLARKINTEQKIVFSNSITEAPWGKWNAATVEAGDPVSNMRKLKSAQGKNIVLWGSVSIAHLLMRENLVDEYHLLICPTLTGGGRKFFPEGVNTNALTLVECKRYNSGMVGLQYRVNK